MKKNTYFVVLLLIILVQSDIYLVSAGKQGFSIDHKSRNDQVKIGRIYEAILLTLKKYLQNFTQKNDKYNKNHLNTLNYSEYLIIKDLLKVLIRLRMIELRETFQHRNAWLLRQG